MTFRIAPLRALRFEDGRGNPLSGAHLAPLVAPPYDTISPEEHRRLLDRSEHNITRLTLGERPGEAGDYRARARHIDMWRAEGVLGFDRRPALHVYGVDYSLPGGSQRRSFRGLLALGSLHELAEGVVRPHERTFAGVVDDRYHLLAAARTHLEPILLLHSDRTGEVDRLLLEASGDKPEQEVEARPGERHALWQVRDARAAGRLAELLQGQRPIIADGHHRYTTACRYLREAAKNPALLPGAGWQPMVLGSLFGEGLSILGTHRLVSLRGGVEDALGILEGRLEPAPGEGQADYHVEFRGGSRRFRVPAALRRERKGAAGTLYGLLHDVVLGQWLRGFLAPPPETPEGEPVRYFKEGTGEREALEREGGLLFRMPPLGREAFLEVVEGGEVLPHKTTFFYPKLWSGLVLWRMEEPVEAPAARPPA